MYRHNVASPPMKEDLSPMKLDLLIVPRIWMFGTYESRLAIGPPTEEGLGPMVLSTHLPSDLTQNKTKIIKILFLTHTPCIVYTDNCEEPMF